jgi:formate dehydrogenase major subunit
MLHGCVPYGNAKARMNAFGLPDAIPVHREPIYTPRIDLVAKYPTLPDAKQFRLPNIGFTAQKAAVDKGMAKQFPLVLSSGRLVEYEGGGEETRSNKWLAELQQDMFVEMNPADAADRGIKDGTWVWVTGHRTRRQGCRVDSVPLRRLVRRQRSAVEISGRHRPRRARRERKHHHYLRV